MKAPGHVNCLEVYLTNQCNMRCIECCVDLPAGAAGLRRLSWKDLKKAIDDLMDPGVIPFSGRKFVAFAGGEPFMSYPVLSKAVRRLGTFPVKPLVFIYTNGSLVRPEWLRELTARGAMVIFSLDGTRGVNDHYRRFAGRSKRSPWDAVMRKIRDVPKDGLGTNSVLRPGNLECLVEAFDEFSRLGFKTIDFWLDYLHAWTPAQLDSLERFTVEFSDYYAGRTLKEGKIPFYVPMLHHALFNAGHLERGAVWWRDCFRLVLGADGNYYDCQGVVCFPPADVAAGSGIGRPAQGVDWAKRQAYMDEADEHLKRAGAEKDWQYVCPRVYYKISTQKGADPLPAAQNLHRASRVFLGGLVKLAARIRENPSFKKEYIDKLAFPASTREPSAV